VKRFLSKSLSPNNNIFKIFTTNHTNQHEQRQDGYYKFVYVPKVRFVWFVVEFCLGTSSKKRPFLITLFLFVFTLAIHAQTRTDVPYLVPQTIFVGDSGRLVVPLGRAFARITPFILDAPDKLPETPELLIRRLELERRSGATRLLIDFIPYSAGVLSLPDLEILSPGEGTEPLVLSGLEVQVASILNPSQMTLSGPASPIAAPGTSLLIYGTIIAFILLLCLGIGISLWGRRHFRELWELFRRRRLINAMNKFLRCLRQECSLEKEGDPNYYLTLLSKEFREFLSLFSGINCRSLTPGEFLELPLSQTALTLGPVYLCWLFQNWETLRFSGQKMEMAEMFMALDEIERLIAALDKEEREKSLPKSLGMPETVGGEGS